MATLLNFTITTTADPLLFRTYTAQNSDLLIGLASEAVAHIECIFTRNLASGRAHRVWKHASFTAMIADAHTRPVAAEQTRTEAPDWPLLYLQQVIRIYRQEGARLLALVQRDDQAWHVLNTQLANSAYQLLCQMGLDAWLANDMALDMAQQACYKIYVSTFPCDVAFDTWAHVILKNQILHQFTRSKELLDRQLYIESLEYLQTQQEDRQNFTPIGQADNAASHRSSLPAKQIEDREWLIGAVAQLSTLERRLVIVYTYFYELSDDEIAEQLGKSKGAIHTLRHRALKQLQALLHGDQIDAVC